MVGSLKSAFTQPGLTWSYPLGSCSPSHLTLKPPLAMQADASNGSAAPAEADVAGLSLSDDSKAQATNGHAQADGAAAASPAAATAPRTADHEAEEPSSEHASSAAAAVPLTQDELIEVCTSLTCPMQQPESIQSPQIPWCKRAGQSFVVCVLRGCISRWQGISAGRLECRSVCWKDCMRSLMASSQC